MEHIDFEVVDRRATGEKLQRLRKYDLNLHRYVCHELHSPTSTYCSGTDCDQCEANDFEEEDINQPDLARVMNVATSQIANWENGKSIPSLENLIFYCRICNIEKIEDLIVLEKPKEEKKK